MEAKKAQIMNVAMRYFSDKGYANTSIQDIASELRIAKGSLYFYFKSKSDLLLAILKQNLEAYRSEMKQSLLRHDAPPRERLLEYVCRTLQFYERDRSFFSMLIRERFEAIDEIQELVIREKDAQSLVLHDLFVSMYGDTIKPVALDLTLIFQAILQSYLAFVVFDHQTIDGTKLAKFLVHQLDVLARTMAAERAESPLHPQVRTQWLERATYAAQERLDVAFEMEGLREAISHSERLDAVSRADMVAALEAIDAERNSEHPDSLNIRAMFALLRAHAHVDRHVLELVEEVQSRLER